MSDDKRRRPVKFRRVTVDRLGDENAALAFCPRTQAVISVVGCRVCAEFSGLSLSPSDGEAFLRCTFGDGDGTAVQDGPAPASVLIDAGQTTLADIMTSPVRSVPADTDLETLAAMFLAERISALPVVDDAGRLVGIISKTDVMQRYYDDAEAGILSDVNAMIEGEHGGRPLRQGVEGVTAKAVMTRAIFSVGASTAISRAAALMAYESVHHLLVVDEHGAALGIVSALDIVRWVARTDGYIVPPRVRPG